MDISLISDLFSKGSVNNHRSILLLKGPKSSEKIPFLHYLWRKNSTQSTNTILWCLKNQKLRKSYGISEKKFFEKNENFNIQKNSMNSFQIRYCYYKETKKILGNTFGMCILQDFESITPNSLARIIETIEGGGVIIFLLETINPLKNLHHLSLEIYNNFKNQTVKAVTSRFLDRFFLSLKDCEMFLSIDNRLQICSEYRKSGFFKKKKEQQPIIENSSSLLTELIKNLGQMEPLSSLLSKTKTFDQARAFLSFAEGIADKKKFSTILLTSGRGRGKSATLGLATSASIAFGYGNIFITAPDPENLHSFFAFLLIGLKTLGYKENQDFEIIQNVKFKCIDRILIYTSHYQMIKFIFPSEIENFKDSIELLIIDEAAAIQFTFLENLVGNFTTFIASTIYGYEGSGKSLNLKMIKKIKLTHDKFSTKFNKSKARIFREIYLEEPIRFSKNDPVEKWLNDLLCMNMEQKSFLSKGCPSLKNCRLFLLDRNALFSSHKIANFFLQKLIGLFSSSHYKNSPDDLQMMCDAPSHRIFVLLSPIVLTIGLIPDILVGLHTSYEGQINIKFVRKCLSKGLKMNGDLIPWAISKNFLDPNFGELAGVRILRIVTNPDSQKMGYGTRTLQLFTKFLEKGKNHKRSSKLEIKKSSPDKKPKKRFIPAILSCIKDKTVPSLDYIGVSFRLSLPLLCFWKKNGFNMFLIRSHKIHYSNEHTVIMIKEVSKKKLKFQNWYQTYRYEFFKKFVNLLGSEFRELSSIIVYNIMETKFSDFSVSAQKQSLKKFFSSFDFQRLFFYKKTSGLEINFILDLFPFIGKLFFWGFFPKNFFSSVETILLVGIGLQYKPIETIKKEINIKTENIFKIFFFILEKIQIFFN